MSVAEKSRAPKENTAPPKNNSTIQYAIKNASIEWIAADAFEVDPSYDRPADEARINRMAETWEDEGLGVVIAARRNEDVLLKLLDGQHRIGALRKLGRKKELVPTLIFEGLTIEQEAAIFVLMNKNRRALKPSELFQASLIEGDIGAKEIKEAFDDLDLILDSTRKGERSVQCVNTVWAIYNAMGKEGVDAVFGMALVSWGPENLPRGVFNELLMSAVARIMHFGEGKVDLDRLRDVLASEEPESWMNRASTIRSLEGGDRKRVLAEQIIKTYNKGLYNTKQLSTDMLKVRKDPFKVAGKFNRRIGRPGKKHAG